MEYQYHKGLRLSKIGVGSYSLSGAYGKKDAKEFKNMINRAKDLGVNFLDTADAYGEAEKILGNVIEPFREEMIISTKVGVKNSTKPNLSYDYIKSACENSLKNLKTDYIDIYNVHFNDPETPVKETIDALEELVKEGKIRKYGLGHLPKPKVKEYIKKGNIFSILMELSAVSRNSSKEILSLCKRNDVAGIAFSVTGRGLLTGKFDKNSKFEKGDIRRLDPQFQKERLEFSLKIQNKLKEIGKKNNMSSVQVAIAWTLSQNGIISALTGPSKVEHLEENIGGIKKEFSEQILEEINQYIKEQEKWLEKEQKNTINKILYENLSEDNNKAFIDLIYSIETAITNEYVKEVEIMPLFYKLYGMRNKLDQINNSELKEIQKKVGRMIKIN